VCIDGADRAGLERLLRYCARPPFALLERLEQLGEDELVYRFDKPQPDGRTQLRLTPPELLDRLATMIPDARLVALDTQNHVLLEHEPSFHQFFEELRAFVPHD